ncbi:MAG: hypothetical protein ACUVXF_10465 [Desulfobaccales bacterium]
MTNNQKMCGDCRKFTPSLDDPGRKGTCPKFPGASVGSQPVLCPYFEFRDHGDTDAPLSGIPSEMNDSQVAHAGG